MSVPEHQKNRAPALFFILPLYTPGSVSPRSDAKHLRLGSDDHLSRIPITRDLKRRGDGIDGTIRKFPLPNSSLLHHEFTTAAYAVHPRRWHPPSGAFHTHPASSLRTLPRRTRLCGTCPTPSFNYMTGRRALPAWRSSPTEALHTQGEGGP